MTTPRPKDRSALGRYLTTQIVRSRLTSFMARHATTETVLDLGSGNAPYASHFPNRIAVDLADRPDIDIRADAHRLPFRTDSLSMVLSTEVLEHTLEPQRVIDEIHRILKPGGTVCLTTRFVFPLHDTPGDFFRFTAAGLRHLFKDWRGCEIEGDTTSWETIGVLLQRMSMQCEFRLRRVTRGCLLLLARQIGTLDRLTQAQYGNVATGHRVENILVSGWYVVATK